MGLRFVVLIAVVFPLAACTPEAHAPATPREAESAVATAAAADPGKVKLEDATGALKMTIKPKDDGFKAYDPQDREIGKAKVEADRVKLKDAQDREILKIKRKDVGIEIEDGAGQRLYRLKPDGADWKLDDAAGNLVMKLKAKDNGYEARDAKGVTLAKVKVREGKVVFETEAGDRLGQLDGAREPLPAAWLALERFTPLERMALYAYFMRVHK
jgi:hypothetical protein